MSEYQTRPELSGVPTLVDRWQPDTATFIFRCTDTETNALGQTEQTLLSSLNMSPLVRAGDQFIPTSWYSAWFARLCGVCVLDLIPYKLMITEATPTTFVTRHKVCGMIAPKHVRSDTWQVASLAPLTIKSTGTVCSCCTFCITCGRSSGTTYEQELVAEDAAISFGITPQELQRE